MTVTIEEAKNYLKVISTDHDTRIEEMLARAIQEASDYINADLTSLSSSSSDGLSQSIKMGILMLVERQWSTPPEKREMLTKAAHAVLDPARCGWGI